MLLRSHFLLFFVLIAHVTSLEAPIDLPLTRKTHKKENKERILTTLDTDVDTLGD